MQSRVAANAVESDTESLFITSTDKISRASSLEELLRNASKKIIPAASFADFLIKLNGFLNSTHGALSTETSAQIKAIIDNCIKKTESENITNILKILNEMPDKHRLDLDIDALPLFHKALISLPQLNLRQASALLNQLSHYGFYFEDYTAKHLEFLSKLTKEFNRNPEKNLMAMTFMINAMINLNMLTSAIREGILPHGIIDVLAQTLEKKLGKESCLELKNVINTFFRINLYYQKLLGISCRYEESLARILKDKHYRTEEATSSFFHKKAVEKLADSLANPRDETAWKYSIHAEKNIIRVGNIELVMEYFIGDFHGLKFKPVDLAIFSLPEKKLIALIEFDGEPHFIKHRQPKGQDIARNRLLMLENKLIIVTFYEFEEFIADPLRFLEKRELRIEVKEIPPTPVSMESTPMAYTPPYDSKDESDNDDAIAVSILSSHSLSRSRSRSDSGSSSSSRRSTKKSLQKEESQKRMDEIIAQIKREIIAGEIDFESIKENLKTYPNLLIENTAEKSDKDFGNSGESVAECAYRCAKFKDFLELLRLNMIIPKISVEGKKLIIGRQEFPAKTIIADASKKTEFFHKIETFDQSKIKDLIIESCRSGNLGDFCLVKKFLDKDLLNLLFINSCYYGRIEFLESILPLLNLDSKANIADHQYREYRMIDAAIMGNHKDVLELFANHDARFDYERLFLLAAKYDADEAITFLLEKSAQAKYKPNLNEIFKDAIHYGSMKIIKLLANTEIVNSQESEEERYMLEYAVMIGKIGPVDFLIENGANTNVRSKEGRDLVSTAILYGHIDLAKFLYDFLDHEISEESSSAPTPLSYAILAKIPIAKKIDIVSFLIAKDISITMPDESGKNAISWALSAPNDSLNFEEKKEILTILLEAAPSNTINNEYQPNISYFDFATLTNFHGNPSPAEQVQIAEFLLDLGVDIFKTDKNQEHDFMKVIQFGSLDLLRKVVEKRGTKHINDTNSEQQSGLFHYVTNPYNFETKEKLTEYHAKTEFLINLEADVNCVSKTGFSLLQHGIMGNVPLTMLQLLISRGASVGFVTAEGISAASVAAAYKNKAALNLLEEYGLKPNIEHVKRLIQLRELELMQEEDKPMGNTIATDAEIVAESTKYLA